MPAPLANTSPYATDAQRWQAVLERDAGADAHFVYAARTTGIYCQPGTAKRLPRRENVVFFESAQ
ncbi:MAG: Ada metal-binding domain-containing protein, partial [Comamonas sp.]